MGSLWQLGITKDEAIQRGYKWQNEIQQTKGKETVSQKDVPDSIHDIDDSITREILACEECDRNYKILPDELILYRRMNVPIPIQCFFCRNVGREKLRGGYDIVQRQCDCVLDSHDHSGRCANIFDTFFTDKESRPIYCEACYQKEVI